MFFFLAYATMFWRFSIHQPKYTASSVGYGMIGTGHLVFFQDTPVAPFTNMD